MVCEMTTLLLVDELADQLRVSFFGILEDLPATDEPDNLTECGVANEFCHRREG